jgi:hypothetical protein
MTAATRRGVLGGLAVLSAPTPALSIAAPPAATAADAELIEASANLIRYMAEYQDVAASTEDTETDARLLELDRLENAALDVLLDTPAATTEGMAAKARALLRWAYFRTHDDEQVARIGYGLALDVLAGDAGFLARLDADRAEREARWAARRAEWATLPPPPPPEAYRDTRTPEEKVAGWRMMVRVALKGLREAQAEMRAAGGVGT